MNSIIQQGNILLYNYNTSDLKLKLNDILKIDTNLQYNEDHKYFTKCSSLNFEFMFTKYSKIDAYKFMYKTLYEIHSNNICSEKRKVIVYNFHVISSNFYSYFKLLLEKFNDTFVFWFTSKSNNIFLSSYIGSIYIDINQNKISNTFKSIIQNDCLKVISETYKPYDLIDFAIIRKELYSLLFKYNDITLILNNLMELAISTRESQSESITILCNQVICKHKQGNKDILYLENYILLLINNNDKHGKY